MTALQQLLTASAGAGKTFRLGGHFTRLLLEGVEPGRILATTFTRKAAGEILERVLGGLARAAAGGKALSDLRTATGRDSLSEAECAACLARLVPFLPRVQVRTLDSWFGHLARLFAFELGLPRDWAIASEVESAALRRRAIGRLLQEGDAERLFLLLRELAKSDALSRVNQELDGLVQVARGAFLESGPDAWDQVSVQGGLSEADLEQALHQLEFEFELPRTKSKPPKPKKTWEKARAALLADIRAQNWEAAVGKGFISKMKDGEFGGSPFTDEHLEVLEPLAGHVAYELVSRVVRRTQAMRSFLEGFEERYRAETLARGRLRFEDVPSLLDPRGETGPPDDLWFRLDGRIDHLLLDEFQDTAPVQWRILSSLASEIIAAPEEGRSFFCVGDTKQSIYGFRAAEPRILDELPHALPGLKPHPLLVNYRSSPIVLATVDQVFAGLGDPDTRGALRNSVAEDAFERWTSRYQPHEPHHTDMPGCAVLWEAEAPEGDESSDPLTDALGLAAERVAALHAAHPACTIGVLFRRRANIPRFQALLEELRVPSSRASGNPLTDSTAVLAALSLLRLADHPGDRAAAFHASSTKLGRLEGLAPLSAEDTVSADLAERLRARLTRDGLVGVLRDWGRVVAAEYDAWNARRFEQFVRLAEGGAGEVEPLRPDTFVEYVRAQEVEDPGAARVRCMTVHASKGLEFDAVVLPELDAKIGAVQPRLLTRRSDVFEPLDVVSAYAKKEESSQSVLLGELKEEASGREFEEACSVLYVALTRARRRLEMILQPAGSSLSHGRLLRLTLGVPEDAGPGELWRAEGSSEACFDEATEESPERPAALVHGLQLGAVARPRLRPVRHASSAVAKTRTLEELLSAESAHARQRGVLVHALLERVEWFEGFDQDDAALAAVLARHEPREATRVEALATFRDALAQPTVQALLRRPEGECEVRCEWPFSVLLEEGGEAVAYTGAIDRLVLELEGGRATRATIIDWKTEAPDEAEEHAAQLEIYGRVVAQTFGLDREQVELRLAFLPDGTVVSPEGTAVRP